MRNVDGYSKAFFNDGTPLSVVEETVEKLQFDSDNLVRTLADYQQLSGNKIDFVGLVELGRRSAVPALLIFLPKGIALGARTFYREGEQPEGDLIRSTKLTLECISRYFSERESVAENLLDGRIEARQTQEWARLDSALWLINDWRANGLHQDSFTRYRPGSPSERVDWKRTIRKHRPMLTEAGPWYQRCEVRQRLSSQSGIISQIHRWCVYQAVRLAGWLAPYIPSREAEFLAPAGYLELDVSTLGTWTQALTSQLDLEFSDRRLELVKRLKAFLEGGASPQGTRCAGMPKFERVWETMCATVLGNQYKERFESYMPQPSYLRGDGAKLGANARQIPDIIFGADAEGYYIVDAKYYDVQESKPGWGDIGKQFLYAWSFREVIGPKAALNNLFLFPSPPNIEDGNLPREIVVERGGKIVPNLSNLICAYFEMNEVMKAYAHWHGCKSEADFRKAIDNCLAASLAGAVPN